MTTCASGAFAAKRCELCRGHIAQARGTSVGSLTSTDELLGRLRGRRTDGFRSVEALLTPHAQSVLTAAWPGEPTRAENRRAARAHWVWTRYVGQEAERVIGRPLGIELDESGLRTAIDHIDT